MPARTTLLAATYLTRYGVYVRKSLIGGVLLFMPDE
jgi:hypothetical protein